MLTVMSVTRIENEVLFRVWKLGAQPPRDFSQIMGENRSTVDPTHHPREPGTAYMLVQCVA